MRHIIGLAVLALLCPLAAGAERAIQDVRPMARPGGQDQPALDLGLVNQPPAPAMISPWLRSTINAARGQVGVTVSYDPAYSSLAFPGGDVPRDRGVCTDVVIRALRDGAQIDLQRAVNRDMKAAFASYPTNWGLKRPDANIDHRRVPNLITFLTRIGAKLTQDAQYLPGDIVTSVLPGNLPHIMIVSDRSIGEHPLVIHNIGAGTREEDALMRYPQTGHFRLNETALARLRALDQ